MITQEDLEKNIQYCQNFTWKEAVCLRKWEVFSVPTKEHRTNIIRVARKMEKIRLILGKPCKITSWYRPTLFNKAIGGGRISAHLEGKAVDFRCSGITADKIREILLPKLEELEIRMEDLPGSGWVHIDTKEPTNNRRFFKP